MWREPTQDEYQPKANEQALMAVGEPPTTWRGVYDGFPGGWVRVMMKKTTLYRE